MKRIGDVLRILKYSNRYESPGDQRPLLEDVRHPHHAPSKPPTATAPPIKAEMTNPEFRKLKIDWGVFQSMTNLPPVKLAAHIYTSCDSSVQTSIINSTEDFFKLNEAEIFELIEKIVTKRSNPTVHRLGFSNLAQSSGEAVKDFVTRLKSHARDCEFACPKCHHDLISINVKDQLVRGLHNSVLQTDILAKSESLNTLEEIVKHAESFEAAVEDQSKLQDASEVMGARTTEYKRMQRSQLNSNWSDKRQICILQPTTISFQPETTRKHPAAKGHTRSIFTQAFVPGLRIHGRSRAAHGMSSLAREMSQLRYHRALCQGVRPAQTRPPR